VAAAEPEVIVHELTALSGKMSARDMRHPERSPMAGMTNRLRTEGTDHLLAAGRAVGARRFVAQSFAAFRWARTGGPVQTEAEPLDPNPPAGLRAPLVGILHLERAVTAIEWGEGLVLRYGGFYGPGTAVSLAPDAQIATPIRKRRFPIVPTSPRRCESGCATPATDPLTPTHGNVTSALKPPRSATPD
jgi:2-alkyl-3-oxoalkanoate reductase